MRVDLDELRRRWHAAFGRLADDELRNEIFDELVISYGAGDRHYHDLEHIGECLREFDEVRPLAGNPIAIEMAIWFHDVVYDGRRNDNEQRSADYADAALQRLGASTTLRGEVADLVLFTRHDRTPQTADGKLIVDIDLASLALAPERFDQNTRKIRLEYAHVAEEDFNRGRAKMLKGFLARPRIYHTDEFFRRCEGRARENLRRALEKLS